MTKEQLEKEAEDKAIELEESQTIGIYDNDEDYEYDRGWNKGEVAGFREGYLAGAEPREKRIKHLEESLLYVTEKSVRQIAELEKENVKLKNRNSELAGQKASLERWYGEAKELLREYIRINLLPPIERNFDDEVKLFEQAEQFLKESEVEK